MWDKFKSFIANDTYFFTFLLLLIGIISFGLGRLSTESKSVLQNKPGLTVLPQLETGPLSAGVGQVVVASKSGTKYHLPTCPGAQQMKPENKIEFASVAEAKAAGYEPAANCPGL